ncbi:DUF1800 domain-containing protein [Dyadobacter fermentans]|uniref:DUF1800 domain-containing protein n=1 Tax=Dyadobacter fermentans TaxID=94254 RepID=UPI001CBD5126|nr:DUF1800 family protein [Dyadobacter fermentans]MBZ1357356.1 DUF1800 domain-containing protein [Dyadobacter fermentans]
MPYLDTYQPLLDARSASHLLRRTTFGPTNQEISAFTGLSPLQAIDQLIANSSLHASPPVPIDLDETKATAGQPFLNVPFNKDRRSDWCYYVRYWWAGLMADQGKPPSILEKLTAFWQNHFVVPQGVVFDYRLTHQNLQLLRNLALGSFKTLAVEVTKDPGMLIFQNGNENTKGRPNENYARELQELFVVGQADFYGKPNYTEDDVKAAAKVLTGWQVRNYLIENSTFCDAVFTPDRHDTGNKTFSSYYNNTQITGRSDFEAGSQEIDDLISMLLRHPHTPRFICRKLYKWYVNPEVTASIEENVIAPLATFFASPENNFSIAPVIRKLLSSDIFFATQNRAAIMKSPMELVIGMLRFYNVKPPDPQSNLAAFRRYSKFAYENMSNLQLRLLDQPSVFGYPPYYQTGLSKNWITGALIGMRNRVTDQFIIASPTQDIVPGGVLIDLVGMVKSIQPNFSDVAGTPSVTVEAVLQEFTRNLLAIDLTEGQKNFLIDTIMMKGLSRRNWVTEWNAYRELPTKPERYDVVMRRCRSLVRYIFHMAEFHLF